MGLEDLRKNLAVKKASSQTSRDAWHDGMVVDPLFASAALYAVKNGSISLADLAVNFHIDPVRSNKILGQLVEYHVIFSSGKKWLVCMPKDMLEKYLVRYIRAYDEQSKKEHVVSSNEPKSYEKYSVDSLESSVLRYKPSYWSKRSLDYVRENDSFGTNSSLSKLYYDEYTWSLVDVIRWVCNADHDLHANVKAYCTSNNLINHLEKMGAVDSKGNINYQWIQSGNRVADAIERKLIERRVPKPNAVLPYLDVKKPIIHQKETVAQRLQNGLPVWSDVQNMTGVQFENYCMEVLRLNGFTDVHGTVTSGDGGVDILARKSGESYAIQCKRWKGSVGYKAVQEIFAGKSLEGADKAVVMTNSHFSQPAHDNAKKLGVLLWDGKYVQSMANVVSTQKSVTQQQPQPKKQSVFGQVVSAFKDITRSPSVLVDYGSIVTVRMDNEVHAFTIVSSSEADINKSRISDTSPIGAALMGHQKGDVVVAHTPDGDVRIDIAAVDNRNVIVR